MRAMRSGRSASGTQMLFAAQFMVEDEVLAILDNACATPQILSMVAQTAR